MQLTLYMLRPDLDDDDWGLREVAGEYESVPTEPIGDLDVELWVRRSPPKQPRWLRDLMSITSSDRLQSLVTQSCAAILLIRCGDYRFVLAYGTGRFAIDRVATQPGFGLRVVANSVAASRVVSADTKGLGGRGRSQRTVMPSAGPLYELGIEPSEEWVRQLEGKPSVELANGASGSDSLKLNIRGFSLRKLDVKLAQIIEKFESSAYKLEYGFLDYFTRVPPEDKSLREELQDTLTEMVTERSTDIDFAAPDIAEPLLVDHYVLQTGKRMSPELPGLAHDAIYDVLEGWGLEDPLHSVRVLPIDSSGDVVGEVYRLTSYITADIAVKGRRYALSAGEWFEIDDGYVEAVQRRIETVPDLTATLQLDTWETRRQKDEGAYNKQLAGARKWKLLDKRNFPIGGPNQKVEICDLLTPTKQLICVKRMSRSGTLSHLFAQGVVSAQLLVANAEGYQNRVMKDLRRIQPGAVFGSRDEWSVVYAIATTKPGPLSQSLFFFSKVSLDRAVAQLNSFGVKVALARIPIKM